jgi:hypothetical protein
MECAPVIFALARRGGNQRANSVITRRFAAMILIESVASARSPLPLGVVQFDCGTRILCDARARRLCHSLKLNHYPSGVCRKKPQSGEMFIARDGFLYSLSEIKNGREPLGYKHFA